VDDLEGTEKKVKEALQGPAKPPTGLAAITAAAPK
jgi:hypothetical protein